jgi:ATP-binding cassette subfamily B protein
MGLFRKRFPFQQQYDKKDCGPACLKMVLEYYGVRVRLQTLREKCGLTRFGTSLRGISEVAEEYGFRTLGMKLQYGSSEERIGLDKFPLPCIAFWQQHHFIVVYKVTRKYVWAADPGYARIRIPRKEFEASWVQDDGKGIVLGIEPTPDIRKTNETIEPRERPYTFRRLLSYLQFQKPLMAQLGLGVVLTLVIQTIFPFLSQSLIDVGVQDSNLGFVKLVLISQLILFLSQTSIQFIQAWILTLVGQFISVSLMSDFFAKVMRLPISFFDTKNIGDINRRIDDNIRVESFLTNSSINIVFSVLSFLVFSIILAIFDLEIFLVFLAFSVAYIGWISLFLKKRRNLDYLSFQYSSESQQTLIEMVYGMQEIKLQGSEQKRRWKWIELLAKQFRINLRALSLRQYQEFGALFFFRIKDIIISFIAASSVIEGDITLGVMVAVLYIVGQLNVPFEQFISFIQTAQDAQISLERLNEVASMDDEEPAGARLLHDVPLGDIEIRDLNFQYAAQMPMVLQDINLSLPQGKVTAIVGASGSGKTTLLKLLLGFYHPTEGSIQVGGVPLNNIGKSHWRSMCGTVMQEGYIFTDTIAANIAESSSAIDFDRVRQALHTANLDDFVNSLPLSVNTDIGANGSGLSQGQKQRVLIARAVYKNPEFLLFDEATNALDAKNERIIMENLNRFFHGKTVLFVAHRLSTVKNADQIVVLDQGRCVEIGTHAELIERRGTYFELIRNQLELDG